MEISGNMFVVVTWSVVDCVVLIPVRVKLKLF